MYDPDATGEFPKVQLKSFLSRLDPPLYVDAHQQKLLYYTIETGCGHLFPEKKKKKEEAK